MQTGNELSEQGTVSEALMEVYSPEFTKETKFEATTAFTSGIIYKYTKVESLYSKETRQKSRNAPEGTRDDDASMQKRLSQTDEN